MNYFVQTILGIEVADFVSGLVHWMFDTYFEQTTPLIGPRIVYFFREHHRSPTVMTKRSFFDVSSYNFFLSLVVSFVWFASLGPSLMLMVFFIFSSLTNQNIVYHSLFIISSVLTLYYQKSIIHLIIIHHILLDIVLLQDIVIIFSTISIFGVN